jgi:peptide chain release factor 1
MQYKQRLDEAEARYNELTEKMADPDVINDPDEYRKIAKQQAELTELAAAYRDWKKTDRELTDARAMLQESDPDLREMAELEVQRLEPVLESVKQQIQLLLVPKDPNDEKDIVIEIRK